MDITVRVDSRHFSGVASIRVDDVLLEAFAPIHETDEPWLYAAGEATADAVAVRVLRLRDDASKMISEAITKNLIEQMSARDTYNGYIKKSDENK